MNMPAPSVSPQSAAARVSAQELARLSLIQAPEVLHWLDLHPEENYLVSEDCSAIYTDRPQSRNTYSLIRVVQRVRQKTPRVVFVDEASFSTFKELADAGEVSADSSAADSRPDEENTDMVRSLEKILSDALESGASDIHLRIRNRAEVLYRIYGVLGVYQIYSRAVGLRLARTAFNYFARTCTDFNEKLPMDGAFHFPFQRELYGVRINLMPEVRGCTLVIRLRAPHRTISCADAGYNPEQCLAIERGMLHSSGLMIFSGPTNSGKSTTMSNLLAQIPVERSVISIEDPVELQLPNVAHVDLSTQASGVDLQSLLGCTVRQDPDILSLAEIRDEKTARYAENMALQGRFVLSTLHTDNVCTIPLRLVKLGMDEENLQAPGFLNLLVAQTLVPSLCPQCCSDKPSDPQMGRHYAALLGDSQNRIRYRCAAGCPHCHAGIAGRSLVAEVLPVDRKVRRLIQQRDYDGIRDHMRDLKIISRHEHARQKILCASLDPQSAETRIGLFSRENLS